MLDALVIDPKDNVATALKDLERGATAVAGGIDGTPEVVVAQDIPFGHKYALSDIPAGMPVIKYGETIGRATADIARGAHVHVHNVEGLRGRGDKQ